VSFEFGKGKKKVTDLVREKAVGERKKKSQSGVQIWGNEKRKVTF
jgi:hypothetical protein